MVLNSSTGESRQRVPLNGGSFRCFDVAVRENCVAGIPRHPASCSLATGEVGVRIWAAILSAFADRAWGLGSAEAGFGAPPYLAVVSGDDPERANAYVTQLLLGTSGGPATAETDGWLSFLGMPAAGLLYRDSVEVDEQKYPILVTRSTLRPDSEGAGRPRCAGQSLRIRSTGGIDEGLLGAGRRAQSAARCARRRLAPDRLRLPRERGKKHRGASRGGRRRGSPARRSGRFSLARGWGLRGSLRARARARPARRMRGLPQPHASRRGLRRRHRG
ncbi:MAG: hydantoinase B/oxoprolinase family protein, partial [Deltaproteobacteria bacterium]|nr:hydantoinase B/oxoprolinase family protein [Deltaproteobacteria bacterium]